MNQCLLFINDETTFIQEAEKACRARTKEAKEKQRIEEKVK